MVRLIWGTILVFAWTVTGTRADEPAKDEEKFDVPPPRPVTSKLLPYYLPSSMPQPGTREVWQYYGVDSRGRWVPRVIMSPYGAYYYYNGAPFPNTTTRPGLFMPYVVD